ncbi:MAG TPA: fibronectin type III domain-containing protein [Thermoanaerobaculia bacterium]|nr:fibronectin type III domain-containing protein [Thermoanaerobaculia bacterium]
MRARFACLSVLAVTLLSGPLFATTVIPVADPDLVDQAAVIVEATIQTVAEPASPAPPPGRLPVTGYRVHVDRVLKGSVGAETLVVSVLGGAGADGLVLKVWGAPRFHAGEQAMFFLLPSADGSYRPLHLALGAFHLSAVDGRRVAWRDLSEVAVLSAAGPGQPERQGLERVRDAKRFAAWIAGRVAAPPGVDGDAPGGYELDLPAAALAPAHEKFTFLNNTEQRWFEFDHGTAVDWHMYAAGQPGLDDGGFGELQTAIAAWNQVPGTNILLRYAGASSASTGFQHSDGQNVVLPEDPNDDIAGSFTCSSPGVGSGILAVGGTWAVPGQHPMPIREADVVIQDGAGCWFNHDSRRAEQVFTHELGHTLGLGHSCGDSLSGPCDTRDKDDALMRTQAHGDERGASIRADDVAGIVTLYPGPGGGPPGGGGPPPAPSGLTATALSKTAIALSWRHGSAGATELRIESRTTGAFQEIETLAPDAAGSTISGLAARTAYTFRLRARNGAGFSDYSNEASATTLGATRPAAPSGLSAVALSADRIQLEWQDNSRDETDLLVEQSSPLQGFAPAVTLPAHATAATIAGLAPGMPYTFRVRARSSAGASPPSNQASVTTRSGAVGSCAGGADTLCLRGGRFQINVQWRNADSGEHGTGKALPSSNQTGLFWFFDPANIELIVKVLDGRAVNGFFWTFYGGLSSVEYWITVTDTRNGDAQTYHNVSGEICGNGDISSLPGTGSSGALGPYPALGLGAPGSDRNALGPYPAINRSAPGSHRNALGPYPALSPAQGSSACAAGPTTLCLLGGRFQVDVTWRLPQDRSSSPGNAVGVTDQSGMFWFFSSSNIELVVKVLDGRPVNGRFWLFYGALSDVLYDLRVTDTATGAVRTYHNDAGDLCGQGDVNAF